MRKRRLFFFLKIILAIVVLLWVVHKVHYKTIINTFQNPQSPRFIVFASMILILNIGLQWYRWYYLLRLIKPDITFKESMVSLFGGLTVGMVTPGRIGEFGRALFLSNIDHVKTLSLIFIDKFYASVIIIVFGIWGLVSFMFFQLRLNIFLMALLIGFGILATGIGIFLLIHPKHVRSFFYHVSLLLPFRDKLKEFINGLDQFHPKNAKPFIFLSLTLYFIYIFQFSLLALAFEKISLNALITSTTSTMVTKIILPFSIGDLGIREGAAIYFFKNFGIQKVTAFNSAFLLFLINVMIPAIIGLIFIPRMGWRENGHSRNPS
ncbi:flippase-like domain-containing protein [bacterium]|nr:flippase-like domain-containing protein [bacterium]